MPGCRKRERLPTNAAQRTTQLLDLVGVSFLLLPRSCDYLLPPAFPDYFSLSSAQAMLTEVLPQWFRWHEEVSC